MKWWRTICAILIFGFVFTVQHVDAPRLQHTVNEIVYSDKDIFLLKEMVITLLQRNDESLLIPTVASVNEHVLEPFHDGYIVQVETLQFTAPVSGFVLFTGYTKESGKTMKLQFADSLTITIGFIEEIQQLPYNFFQQGDVLFTKIKGPLYIAMERQGEALSKEQLIAYWTAFQR